MNEAIQEQIANGSRIILLMKNVRKCMYSRFDTEDTLPHMPCVHCVRHTAQKITPLYTSLYIEKPRKHTVFGVCKFSIFAVELSLAELRCATGRFETVLK